MKKKNFNLLQVNEIAVKRIPEYYNKEFTKNVKKLANDVCDYAYNEKLPDTYKGTAHITSITTDMTQPASEPIVSTLDGTYGVLHFYMDLKWIDDVFILVNKVKYADNFCTLGRTGMYRSKFVRKNGITKETEFKWNEIKCSLEVNDKKCPPLVRDENFVKLATICISLKEKYTPKDLYYILYHEFTHIYQMVLYNANILQQTKSEIMIGNTNIIDYDNYDKSILFNNRNISLKLYNEPTQQGKIKIIKNMSADDIFSYVKLVRYDINQYEVGPYLTNIAKELNNCSTKKLVSPFYKRHNDYKEDIKEALRCCSNTYKEFESIAHTFELFKKHTPVDVKLSFAKDYIRTIIGNKWPDEIGYIFDRSFKDMYNGYSSDSFNEFCDVISMVIYDALDDAIDIFQDIVDSRKDRTLEESIARKHYKPYKKPTFWYVEYYINL